MNCKIPKADYKGQICIGDLSISCAVLDTGERILVDRSLATALGVKGSGGYWKRKKEEKGAELPEYISTNYLAPFIDDKTKNKLTKTIIYTDTGGGLYEGVSASLLVDICDIWQRADQKGALENRPNAKLAAKKAYIIFRGFAEIGIIGLVDEATGYQDFRAKDALSKILEKFIDKELQPWTQTFPYEFYEQIFRLKDWPVPDGVKRPSVIGHYTNDFVYDRLAPGVLKELRHINPILPDGRRKSHHHQWFTPDIGHPKLKEHLAAVTALMRASPNWGVFKRNLQRAFPKLNETIPMNLEDD